MRGQEPYSILAAFYDGGWSDYSEYAAELIGRLEEESRRHFDSVCDAACGTGLFLQHLDDGDRHLAGYDRSPQMVDLARARVPRAEILEGDLRDEPPCGGPFELVTCLYDSLNYLTKPEELRRFFEHSRGIAAADGVLVVDLNDALMYRDRDGTVHHRLIDGVGIRERLEWDPGPPPIATTTFDFPGGREAHVQRAWDADEVEPMIEAAGWRMLDSMDVVDDDDDSRSGKIVYIAVAD